jgi:peptidoglycan biosynthesis protein MviN/MurJ (putative lipid II flippase)
VGVYLVVAFALIEPLGFLGLVLADSAKHVSHAATMLVLTWRQLGSLSELRLGQTLLKALLASGVMVGVMGVILGGVTWFVGDSGLIAGFVAVVGGGGAGFLAYLTLSTLLRVEEVGLLRELIQRRLGGPSLD